jgi:hypothetical protein
MKLTVLPTNAPQVLNGTLTSPPDTPPTQQDLFQPGPREPTFSASTYKPPAFYPNKKPRTELGLDPSPNFNPRSSLSSPGVPAATLETRSECTTQRMTRPHGHLEAYSGHESNRRASMYQVPTLRHEHNSPDAVNYQYSRGHTDDMRSRANGAPVTAPHRSPEAASFLSSRPEAPYGHMSMAPSRNYFPPSTDRYAIPTSRRTSVVSQREFAPPHPVEPSRNAYPPTRPTHYSLPMRDEAALPHDHPHYIERNRLQQQEAYTKMAGYQESQPTFFMPSHYDYQQGKTRKRSNLPKQSTEIMKTWFDQVNQRADDLFNNAKLTVSRTSRTPTLQRSRKQCSQT